MPRIAQNRCDSPGSQAYQLHPTFLRLPGIISELLARALRPGVFHSRSVKELPEACGNGIKAATKIFRNALISSGL